MSPSGTTDEHVHEIQLNGKQLVFLFMAATVVSVVIFLCGVMVGRGVRAERGASGDTIATEAAEPRAVVETASTPAQAPLPDDAPPAPVDESSPVEDLVGASAKPADSRAERPEPIPTRSGELADKTPAKKAADPAKPLVADGRPTEPGTFAVQLAALRERAEAEAIVRQLVAKGYPAYVLSPAPGAPPMYRVQVGRFKARGDAEKAAARLKKDQYSPWVTR